MKNVADKNSVIPFINEENYQKLVEKNVISEGMIPKLHNCFNALNKGVSTIKIGNQSLLNNLTDSCTILSLK